MDASQVYIEMCRQATEIQGMLRDYEGPCPVVVYPSIGVTVWLPRQDELQEIDGEIVLRLWLAHLYDLARETDFNFQSMEQLTLMYVMRHRYGKTWDGKEWVHDV